jgi:hypothetical protein
MTAAVAVGVDNSSSLRWAFDYPMEQPERVAIPAIRLGGRVPPWAHIVVDRIVELARLPRVDARNSRSMNVEDVIDALDFLKHTMRDDTLAPWIGRLNSGGVQLTWRSGDVEVEAVFDRARDEQELIVAVGDNEWDAPITQADSLFASVVDRLTPSHVEYSAA